MPNFSLLLVLNGPEYQLAEPMRKLCIEYTFTSSEPSPTTLCNYARSRFHSF